MLYAPVPKKEKKKRRKKLKSGKIKMISWERGLNFSTLSFLKGG